MGSLLSKLFGDDHQGQSLPKQLQLSSHTIKFVRKIADGGYAKIFLVRDVSSDRHYALKVFDCLEDEQRQAFTKTEIETLTKFKGKSPHIINLIDTDNFSCVLLPFYSSGSIQSKVDKERATRNLPPYVPITGVFSRPDLLEIALGLCRGCLVFHQESPPLAHRDICPANVLITSVENKPRAILMDFGSTALARISTDNHSSCVRLQELAEATCSALYRAPELYEVLRDSLIDERTDVWVCLIIVQSFYFFILLIWEILMGILISVNWLCNIFYDLWNFPI
jgi:serine/threonine kinase 16